MFTQSGNKNLSKRDGRIWHDTLQLEYLKLPDSMDRGMFSMLICIGPG